MKHRLHVVRWRDAHGNKDEDQAEDVLKKHRPVIYLSAGILFKSDEVGVTLAMDIGVPQDDTEVLSYRQRGFIPRELVVEEYDAGPVVRRAPRASVGRGKKATEGGSDEQRPTESEAKD